MNFSVAGALLNLEIMQGATWSWSLIYADEQGQPVDLTGVEVCMQLRSPSYTGAVALELTLGEGVTLGTETGTLIFLVDADVTGALTALGGVYDLGLKFPGGFVTKILRGNWTLIREVSKCL